MVFVKSPVTNIFPEPSTATAQAVASPLLPNDPEILLHWYTPFASYFATKTASDALNQLPAPKLTQSEKYPTTTTFPAASTATPVASSLLMPPKPLLQKCSGVWAWDAVANTMRRSRARAVFMERPPKWFSLECSYTEGNARTGETEQKT
jgi:hypothetical protein